MAEVFQRLLGMETEYAIRSSSDTIASRRSKFRHYESLVAALHRRVPTVVAKHFKEGVFTANGGAVWFEAERPAAGGGLIEGATPECRGPRVAVTYQRAQDRLLSEAAADQHFQLIKNDRDARDNVYGAQENYEATLASGVSLLLWRLGLVGLIPLAVVTWLAIACCVVGTLLYFVIAAIIYLPIKLATGGSDTVALCLFGRDLVDGREACIHVPVWLEWSLQIITRILTAPMALALYTLLRATAFRQTRQRLVPFLITRQIFAGAGMLDSDGEFQLSDKAPAINCLVGYGGMVGDRPVFSMGHFFKAVYADSWFAPREYFELFSPRQRLQIGIGDSNMCETAEYLRISTTLLVLDAIEAGALQSPPAVKRPVRALHDVCRDESLTHEFPLRDGQTVTALQVQRYYLSGCREFLSEQPDAPDEAWEVLQLWTQTLNRLEQLGTGEDVPTPLVGSIDWVTKKYLLDKSGADASWAERKKIDLRYHELSEDGYFAMLQTAGLAPRVVEAEAIDRAMRLAPANSPATTRGHYIREFAHGDEPVMANWKSIVIGPRWGTKTIRLANYGRSPRQPRDHVAARRLRRTTYRDRN